MREMPAGTSRQGQVFISRRRYPPVQQGVWCRFYARKVDLPVFTEVYESVLGELGFRITARLQDGSIVRIKAMWGDRAEALMVSGLMEFGSSTIAGNRYCMELQAAQYDDDVFATLVVIPYMALFDRPEVFLLSQGVVERLVDENNCAEIRLNTLLRLRNYGLVIETC